MVLLVPVALVVMVEKVPVVPMVPVVPNVVKLPPSPPSRHWHSVQTSVLTLDPQQSPPSKLQSK